MDRSSHRGCPATGFSLVLCLWLGALGVVFGQSEPKPRPWSLRPLKRVAPPEVVNTAWPRNAIDRFVLARLEREGLEPSPKADQGTLVRRMSWVMLGLPPSPEEVASFVDDQEPNAEERLIARMLASPRYGERWARHWLDVVRFAETNGFETNTPRPNAWPYRDWVIKAFNEDLPYDRFVTAQLAGDLLADDAATGFLVAGSYDEVKSPDPVLTATQRQDELADMVNATSTAFLGMTIACARCHDHKFDPITQEDYFAVVATLSGVRHGERPLRTPEDRVHATRGEELEARVRTLRAALDRLPQRPAVLDAAILMDDEAVGRVPGVTVLASPKGHGENPAGTARGFRDDLGTLERDPNLSGGRYTWWEPKPEQDLLTYQPGVSGPRRVGISWGAGHDTHAEDARYLLDHDGDLSSTDDQTVLATVDQRGFAEGTRSSASQSLWSGFRDVGIHEFLTTSCIVVRAGATTKPVTADVIVVAPVGESRWATGLKDPVRADENVERFPPIRARAVRFTAFTTNSSREPCLDELQVFEATDATNAPRNVALASAGGIATSSGNYTGDPKHQLAHVNDGLFGNGHSWISNTLGSGWVRIDLEQPTTIDRVTWGRDREKQFADRLATDYVIEVLVDDSWITVASSTERLPVGVDPARAPALRMAHLEPEAAREGLRLLDEIGRVEEEQRAWARRPQVYAGRFEQPGETHLLRRGDPMLPGAVVSPNIPSVLGDLALAPDAPESERRMAFARALVDPENPLTARVIANRVWMYHFGEGLVDTPSDFGRMGTRPSHPELLDWLASELITHGYRLKHLQRLILSSATWAQASRSRPEAARIDAGSRLLWRFPPRRLEAEAIRDGTLFLSGELALTMGGPGFELFEPNDNYVRVYEPRRTFGKDAFRRMIYARGVRMERDATFGALDIPDAGQVCPKRSRSTTALQVLSLLNSPFVLERAEALAQRIIEESGVEEAAQVERGFVLTFGRSPDPVEARGALDLVKAHGLKALCRAFLNANEFLYLP